MHRDSGSTPEFERVCLHCPHACNSGWFCCLCLDPLTNPRIPESQPVVIDSSYPRFWSGPKRKTADQEN
jgi:hypothetical protein